MQDCILLVDGSNLLFQMFYGMPARIKNSDGKPIHGVLGFVGALLKIIRMTEPTHVAVIFDGECKNARCDLDSDYKANRPDFSDMPEEETPFSQLPDIYKALNHLRIAHCETVDCEPDDIIAAYTISYRGSAKVVISSFDSDFFQLIGDNVSVLRYRGKNTTVCTAEYIIGRYGVYPEQYADFKSLVGDISDNIKGADKIGPKTAAALLKEYGTLEKILESAENIAKPSIRKSVIENAERLKLNQRLIKLNEGAKKPFDLGELRFEYSVASTNDVLKAIGLI